MRYKIITLVATLGMISCQSEVERKQSAEEALKHELDSTSTHPKLQYQTFTLEGCEYIVVSPGNGHFTWGSHKGNCRNPLHQQN
jgi:hypothetical protein